MMNVREMRASVDHRALLVPMLVPRYWGSGKSASADGTKWNLYEQNLLSEYHVASLATI